MEEEIYQRQWLLDKALKSANAVQMVSSVVFIVGILASVATSISDVGEEARRDKLHVEVHIVDYHELSL